MNDKARVMIDSDLVLVDDVLGDISEDIYEFVRQHSITSMVYTYQYRDDYRLTEYYLDMEDFIVLCIRFPKYHRVLFYTDDELNDYDVQIKRGYICKLTS